MKIRNGFVSNSSSSSFMIGVLKNQKPCDCCGRDNSYDAELLKYLLDAYESSGAKLDWMENAEETLEHKIDELKKDREWVDCRVEILNKLKGNYLINHAILKIEELKDLFIHDKKNETVRWGRQRDEYNFSHDKNSFMRELDHLKSKAREIDKEIIGLNDKLEKVIKCRKEGMEICCFDIDNYCSKIGDILKSFLRSGRVNIIEEIHT